MLEYRWFKHILFDQSLLHRYNIIEVGSRGSLSKRLKSQGLKGAAIEGKNMLPKGSIFFTLKAAPMSRK